MSRSRKYLFAGLAVLVVLLGSVGTLIQIKVQNILQAHTEVHVQNQAKAYSEEISHNISRELEKLHSFQLYDNGEIGWQSLDQEAVEGKLYGLLTIQGKAIRGRAFSSTLWNAVNYAAHGEERINYKKGQGMLFAVPVYSGANVSGVLYSYYGEEAMQRLMRMDLFGGEGRGILIVDDQQVPLTYDAWNDLDIRRMDAAASNGVIAHLQKGIDENGVAAVTYEGSGVADGMIFYGTTVPGIRGTFIGYVPSHALGEDLYIVGRMVTAVFLLLAILFALGCVYLITAEKKNEENEELKLAREAADKANQAKSNFLASMSHEIRTPLNAILGLNELIERESTEKDVQEYARDVGASGRALLSLINDMLDFSRIEAGHLTLAPREYELAVLIREVVQMLKLRAENKGLDFTLSMSEDMPRRLYGDPGRVRQVIVNLLTNAVKYTHEGSVKLVITYILPDQWNAGLLEPPPGHSPRVCLLACRVEDTGIGIRREDLKNLFHTFVRLEENRNRNIEGTGLGLALTHKLVAAMGGFLDVASVYGAGSSFTVWIPQYIADAEPVGRLEDYQEKKEVRHYDASFIAPEAQILVVDDNKMNRFVTKNLLKATKVQVTLAASGHEALKLLAERHFDLVLLDHMMPQMDGVETLQIALEQKLVDNTPVIALTANAIAGSMERYISMGFSDYLSKPVSGVKLEQMVKKHLPPQLLQDAEAAQTVQTPQDAKNSPGKGIRSHQDESLARLKAETMERAEAENHMPPKQMDLIDENAGLGYCADDWDIYNEMLEIFAEERPDTQSKLAKAIQSRDWNSYTTYIHGLKSTALSIGAISLSNKAKELEAAGKAGDEEFIMSNHEACMDLYNLVADAGASLAAARSTSDENGNKEEE